MNKMWNRKAEDDDLLQIYFDQIKTYPLLERKEEVELARLSGEGNKDALQKLIKANLRLVVKIARSYLAPDIQFMDLIQEGNMGLMHAAEKFDYTKNVRFCTYAGWWIRQFIIRYMANKHRMVRLPHRKEEILRKVQRTYHSLSQTLTRQPRTEEIAGELGIPVKDIDFILNMSYGILSLEMDNGKDDYATTMEVHEDYTYCPERDLFRQFYRDSAWRCLNKLKDRERTVLSYRYQLEDDKQYTFREIGAKMDLSPEMVRQIELKALANIRRHASELDYSDYQEAI